MSIFSKLPHDIIMKIIHIANQMDINEYYQREIPKNHINLTKKINHYLKTQSDLISELSNNDYKYYRTLLPVWAMEQQFNKEKNNSKIWILPYSTTLLEFTMSDSYWNLKQKKLNHF